MKTISLYSIPNQLFSFNLNNDRYQVELNSRKGNIYLSYWVNEKAVLLNRICLNKVSIDNLFMFEDTQGTANPYYIGFNDRFKLRLLD